MYALGFGLLSEVLVGLGVGAGVFAGAGSYVGLGTGDKVGVGMSYSTGGGDNVWKLNRLRAMVFSFCSFTIHRSSSVCDSISPRSPLY